MYRPTIQELLALFDGTSLHKAAVLRASRFAHDMHGDYRSLFRMLVRAAVPFYRSRRWWGNLRRLSELAVGYKVTCVILRKESEPLRKKESVALLQAIDPNGC